LQNGRLFNNFNTSYHALALALLVLAVALAVAVSLALARTLSKRISTQYVC
jgi:hypothetical protein